VKSLVSQPPLIQAKLTINQPGDRYEQEADRVAERVMMMPEPGVQRQVEPEEEEEEMLQTKPLAAQITPLIQRQIEPEEEEEEGEELIQEKETSGQTPQVSPILQTQIHSLRGGGRPLSGTERSFFEPRFGTDFSNVRIHNDMGAASVAKSVNARAFTLGHNVVFGAGEYSTDALANRKLLAHELTHVVQQNGGLTRFSTRKHSKNTIPNSQELSIVSQEFVQQARTSQPAVLQREQGVLDEEPPRCENPEDITNKVRDFRTKVVRQIARNPSLRNATLPAVPLQPREEAVERLISRLESTTPPPQLISPANATMAWITLDVLSDAPRFAFDTVCFSVCDRINLPELQIAPGQRFGGFVDINQTSIHVYYERSFQTNLESFLEADDLTALRSVLALIAHEKRHVTLQGVPGITVPSTRLQEGAERGQVNYYIEELLVTAEEIKVNTLSDQYSVSVDLPQYSVSVDLQHAIRRWWRFIEQSVDAAELERVRGRIQDVLRTRYGSGNCDNAISTGMLSAMSFGQWYRCGVDGRVARLPDGVTPCIGSNNTHLICNGVVPEPQVFRPGLNL
jgi:hypothetical protein